MTGIAVVPLIYVDTNGLLTLKEYQERAAGNTGTLYRERGLRYQSLLALCATKGFRVATLSFTIVEMLAKYQSWKYYEKKIDERALYDEVFGGSKKALYQGALEGSELLAVVTELDAWLSTAPVQGTVQLYPAGGIMANTDWTLGFWEVTRLIYKYVAISAADCLHVAAAVVMGADCFVSNDAELLRDVNALYRMADFQAEAGNLLGVPLSEIRLRLDALNVKTALGVLARIR
jgi:hypothetical protein